LTQAFCVSERGFSSSSIVILEVGDRANGDEVTYPTDDTQAVMGEDGKWRFAHKDGAPY
jgi:uncharacterized cupin superfamily protein